MCLTPVSVSLNMEARTTVIWAFPKREALGLSSWEVPFCCTLGSFNFVVVTSEWATFVFKQPQFLHLNKETLRNYKRAAGSSVKA